MTTAIGPSPLSSILARGVGFLALWIILIGAAPKYLPIGVIAAAAAAWASEMLWPAAGTARRALCAVMSLQPGKLPVAGSSLLIITALLVGALMLGA